MCLIEAPVKALSDCLLYRLVEFRNFEVGVIFRLRVKCFHLCCLKEDKKSIKVSGSDLLLRLSFVGSCQLDDNLKEFLE